MVQINAINQMTNSNKSGEPDSDSVRIKTDRTALPLRMLDMLTRIWGEEIVSSECYDHSYIIGREQISVLKLSWKQ